MLPRIPAFAVWLQWHGKNCLSRKSCPACCLWGSRFQLGSQKVQAALVSRLDLVNRRFGDGEQHDAEEFLASLLDALREAEVRERRFAPWSADARTEVTHVDRLCAYVQETRTRCLRCAAPETRSCYERDFVLSLPAPPAPADGSRPRDVDDHRALLPLRGRGGPPRP